MRRSQKLGFEAPDAEDVDDFAIVMGADDEAADLRGAAFLDVRRFAGFLAVFLVVRFFAALRFAGLRAAAFLAVLRLAALRLAGLRFAALRLAGLRAAVFLVERFFAGALLFEVVRFAALRLAGLRAAAFLVVRRLAGMGVPLFHAPNGAEQG